MPPTSPTARTGFDALRRSVAGWWPERVAVGHRRAGRDDPRGRPPPRRGRRGLHPHRPRRRAARRRHRHRDRGDQPRPRPRAARTRRLGVRHAHRAGQRPGRPRARAEVRPAARLPQDHRSRPPARTSPAVWGVDPAVDPRPRHPGGRAAAVARHAGRAAGAARARIERRRVGAERRRRAGGARSGSTCSSCRTSSSPRPRRSRMSSSRCPSGPRRRAR